MPTTATQATTEAVQSLIQAYYDAWTKSDKQTIMAFYSEGVVLQVPTGRLEGKPAVWDGFVKPLITGFPSNVHKLKSLAYGDALVAVEWSFEATHKGRFADVAATGRQVQVPGCSFYEYDLRSRTITAGRLYYDAANLLGQIGG